jgi:hypothetical protein
MAEDRYWLTDLVDDFRDDRSPAELGAVACKLYPLACNFVLRVGETIVGRSARHPWPNPSQRSGVSVGRDS